MALRIQGTVTVAAPPEILIVPLARWQFLQVALTTAWPADPMQVLGLVEHAANTPVSFARLLDQVVWQTSHEAVVVMCPEIWVLPPPAPL